MPHRAIIVAGGEMIDRRRLEDLAAPADTVIAADSGLIALRDCGISPTVVVGDFDSVPDELLQDVSPRQRHADPGRDDTDLEKALRFAVAKGARDIDLVGGTGDRLDHSINAVSLILKYRLQARITIHDAGGWATLADRPPMSFGGRIGEKLSLIPAPAAYGLQSEGLRYQLTAFDLVIGGRDAISNEIISTPVTLRWREGSFLIYRQLPPA